MTGGIKKPGLRSGFFMGVAFSREAVKTYRIQFYLAESDLWGIRVCLRVYNRFLYRAAAKTECNTSPKVRCRWPLSVLLTDCSMNSPFNAHGYISLKFISTIGRSS